MFVEPGEVAIVAIVFGTTAGTILSLAKMKMRANQQRSQIADPGVDERLYRIEQAVDAMAVEIERMAESQRFTARLLSERLPTPEALPGAERGRT
ncbi:MAG TPA: hypothetical protein VF128_13190 [Gemmatimonadaceae bacterium]